ncbi:MAG: ROK family protein [Mangrovibacterium sp.]
MDFFSKNIKEINNENRQYAQKRKIVSVLIKSGEPLTIPDLCITIKTSIPKGTKLVNELMEEGIVVEFGKKETENGRKPVLYKINVDFAFAVGVIVQLKGISFSVFNLEMEEIYQKELHGFILEDTKASLDEVVDFIRSNIEESGVDKDKLLGIGIGITGRVNAVSGDSYTFFNSTDLPFSKYLEKQLAIRVYIDNDTHVIGLAEQVFGQAKNVKDALVVNLSRGLGLTIIANHEIVNGSNGFAGEFGHMQFFNTNKKLCICGKRGCLGSDVSGYALEENFIEKINTGESSLIQLNEAKSIQYENILDAACRGDVLSISLVSDMGFMLGKALGNIINLLNPELVIIGGKFTKAKEVFSDSVKSGMMHTTLIQPLRSCTIVFSSVGPSAGIKGAGALVLRQMGII